MNDIFLTSDPHYFHAKIAYLCKRPVLHIEKYSEVCNLRDRAAEKAIAPLIKELIRDMNNTLHDNWNKTVPKGSTVYVLGDFSWAHTDEEKAEVEKIFNSLNGDKHLILGNHDNLQDMKNLRWSSVSNYKTIKRGVDKAVLFHYPIAEHDGYWRGVKHAYGHVHSSPHKKFNTYNTLSYDVGVDNNNMSPISFDDFVKKVDEQNNNTSES